jgi:hypothetical protein
MATQDRDAGRRDFESSGRVPNGPVVREQEPRGKAREVAEQAQEKAGQALDQAQQQARSALNQQKGRAAEGMESMVQALRDTGRQLRHQEHGTMAQYTEQAADKIENFSSSLREKDVDEIVRDVENFARREPALFLGGALALGFMVSRFLKSSERRRYEYGDYSGGMEARPEWRTEYSRPESQEHFRGEGATYGP